MLKEVLDKNMERAQQNNQVRAAKISAADQVRAAQGRRPNFWHNSRVARGIKVVGLAGLVLSLAQLKDNGGSKLVNEATRDGFSDTADGVKAGAGVVAGAAGAAIGVVIPDCIHAPGVQVGSSESCSSEGAGDVVDTTLDPSAPSISVAGGSPAGAPVITTPAAEAPSSTVATAGAAHVDAIESAIGIWPEVREVCGLQAATADVVARVIDVSGFGKNDVLPAGAQVTIIC